MAESASSPAPRLAVYAGTFDPVTAGHLSVIESAAAAFDRLIVLIAVNPAKKPLFSLAERLELLRKCTEGLANVTCEATDGMVVSFARERGARFLVRGVRDATDAEYETRLANINRTLAPEISTFFIPADPVLAEVSSSELKRIAADGQNGSRYCHPLVWKALVEKTGCPVGEAKNGI